MILTQQYKLTKGTILNNSTLTSYINSFWTDILSSHPSKGNIHALILCKVNFINNETRTLAHMRKVNLSEKELFIEYITGRLWVLNETYKDTPISSISFDYVIQEGLASGDRALLKSEVYVPTKFSYNNMNIPLSMNPSDFGEIISKQVFSDNLTRFIVKNGPLVIQIDQYSEGYSVVHYLGAVDLKFTDTILNNLTFKRQIEKEAIYIREGEIVYREKELPAKPFKSIKPEKVISDSDSFCTIDIETVSINGIQTPYLICGYIYGNFIFEYADDLTEEAQNKMFHNFISKLLQKRQIKNVYAHNLSGFDGILLLKHLINYDRLSVKPIIFNGKLMGIAASYLEDDNEKTKPFNFKFKDSYLLLPIPLRKLCTSFKVPTVKSHFPFLLSDINYSGDFPAFEFFNHLS